MTSVQITNLLITILIGMITFLAKRLIGKIDKFEKTVENILLSDLSNKKDIENLKEDVKDHAIRIYKLETEQ